MAAGDLGLDLLIGAIIVVATIVAARLAHKAGLPALSSFQPGYASRICKTWMALASHRTTVQPHSHLGSKFKLTPRAAEDAL